MALAHVESGRSDGPPVVLLGSLGSTVAMWDPVLPVIEPHVRVLRADLRGHGASPVPEGAYAMVELAQDVVDLLDRLDLPRAHVVGISLGGMVAATLAATWPGRVDRLGLLCTTAYAGGAQAWQERAAAVRAAGAAAVAGTVVSRWFTPAYAEAHPEVVARYRDGIAATPAQGYAGCCEAIAAYDLRARLVSITAPTLVVSAAQDPSIPPEHQVALAAGIADARLVSVDPAAHLVPVERPEAVGALLLDHLAR